jgi:hypothetical protein
MVPCFLLIGMGLETHDVYAMGYMNLNVHSLSILTLIAMAWRDEEVASFGEWVQHQPSVNVVFKNGWVETMHFNI